MMIDREQLMTWLHDFYGCDSLYFYEEANALIDKFIDNGVMELTGSRGEWIPVELNRSFGSFAGIRCSLCDFEKIKSPLVKAPNYCENCGAKMKIIFEENN